MTLDELLELIRRWLHLPDPAIVEIALATVVANLLPGDPLWMMLVGPSGSGKTEIVDALRGVPSTRSVSTFTKAALLPGMGKATGGQAGDGGLLLELGNRGVLLVKDWTSMLSESPETVSEAMALLREVYDGHLERRVGTAGGMLVRWEGKVGLLAAVTEAIESHRHKIGLMGERFLYYRLPAFGDADRLAMAKRAHRNAASTEAMRRELAEAVATFVEGVQPESTTISEPDARWLQAVADFAARARSVVERNGYHRDIEFVPEPELPTRTVGALTFLWEALELIGCDLAERQRIVRVVASSGMPVLRRRCLDVLAEQCDPVPTSTVAGKLGIPRQTVRRHLEDLAAHGLAVEDVVCLGSRATSHWSITDWTRGRIALLRTVTDDVA
jgi:hypothetical protein